MAEYNATVLWQREQSREDFLANRYSRRHLLRFDGGVEIAGSASPHIVPAPWSETAAVDPEEAFVAALSGCHMLWFLSLAAEGGYCVESYEDVVVGVLGKSAEGRLAMTRVTLRPRVIFEGNQPTPAELEALHHAAHDNCFIANSVKTELRCEPR
jgi:organic hydroperoxide reductase OsmC/OhrA